MIMHCYNDVVTTRYAYSVKLSPRVDVPIDNRIIRVLVFTHIADLATQRRGGGGW